jgi:hypothetical protein
MEEITNEVAGDVLVGMEPEENLRLQRFLVVKTQSDRTDGRDLSPLSFARSEMPPF